MILYHIRLLVVYSILIASLRVGFEFRWILQLNWNNYSGNDWYGFDPGWGSECEMVLRLGFCELFGWKGSFDWPRWDTLQSEFWSSVWIQLVLIGKRNQSLNHSLTLTWISMSVILDHFEKWQNVSKTLGKIINSKRPAFVGKNTNSIRCRAQWNKQKKTNEKNKAAFVEIHKCHQMFGSH